MATRNAKLRSTLSELESALLSWDHLKDSNPEAEAMARGEDSRTKKPLSAAELERAQRTRELLEQLKAQIDMLDQSSET